MNWFKPKVKYMLRGFDEGIAGCEHTIEEIAARMRDAKEYVWAIDNGKHRALNDAETLRLNAELARLRQSRSDCPHLVVDHVGRCEWCFKVVVDHPVRTPPELPSMTPEEVAREDARPRTFVEKTARYLEDREAQKSKDDGPKI
jgi:hypothetical protein